FTRIATRLSDPPASPGAPEDSSPPALLLRAVPAPRRTLADPAETYQRAASRSSAPATPTPPAPGTYPPRSTPPPGHAPAAEHRMGSLPRSSGCRTRVSAESPGNSAPRRFRSTPSSVPARRTPPGSRCENAVAPPTPTPGAPSSRSGPPAWRDLSPKPPHAAPPPLHRHRVPFVPQASVHFPC